MSGATPDTAGIAMRMQAASFVDATVGNDAELILKNEFLSVTRQKSTYTVTLDYKDGNALDADMLVAMRNAYDKVRAAIGTSYQDQDKGACLVLTGKGTRVFSTGVPLSQETPSSNILREAFGPLLFTILTFPFPTICLTNGLCEGGACILALCHDYRILNQETGCISFDAIRLGAHFAGIAGIARVKLSHAAARTMVLEGRRLAAAEALNLGIVDSLEPPQRLIAAALQLAEQVAPHGSHGTYGLMRKELIGDEALSKIVQQCM